jgi:uncharacterized protein YggE
MSPRFLSVAAAAALLLAATGAAQAQPSDAAFHATTLHLSAYGEVKIKPDMASLQLGVTTEAPTAQAAMQDNAARMNAVIAAVRAAGIRAEDVQTSGLNLNPQYRYEQNQPPQLTGYQASNMVTVSAHDLARAGALLDAAVKAGANQVHGIDFTLADPTAAENTAREAAVRALNAKAELYARATGLHIVRLVSLSEGSAGPRPVYQANDVVVTAARVQPTPVAAGELTVRETVNGEFEVAR